MAGDARAGHDLQAGLAEDLCVLYSPEGLPAAVRHRPLTFEKCR